MIKFRWANAPFLVKKNSFVLIFLNLAQLAPNLVFGVTQEDTKYFYLEQNNHVWLMDSILFKPKQIY